MTLIATQRKLGILDGIGGNSQVSGESGKLARAEGMSNINIELDKATPDGTKLDMGQLIGPGPTESWARQSRR
ncbi:hypothetical protein V6N13_043835 [Hibiscus sabdariffa]